MQNGSLCVDHVFMLVDATESEQAIAALRVGGLTPSSRRSHGRLGTSNVFFCFDNVFLEILWVVSQEDAARSSLARQLLERTQRRSGGCPFGIGFRTAARSDPLPFETWDYHPPGDAGLANDVAIAVSSSDSLQPLLFRAQRSLRPDAWTDGNAGLRQRPGGYSEVAGLRLCMPVGVKPSVDLSALERLGMLTLGQCEGGCSDIEVTVVRMSGSGRTVLSLSRLDWIA